MPPGVRSNRQRIVGNENDENAGSIRLTRAKAAALEKQDDPAHEPTKKPLQAKKGPGTLNNQKRTALGDVSNVSKPDRGKNGKKGASGMTSKTTSRKRASTSVSSSKQDVPDEAEPPAKRVMVEGISSSRTVQKNNDPELFVPSNVKNLDADDVEDPLMASEYARDIFEYFQVLELQTMPNPDYMAHQDELEWKTRSILVDWLIEVHTRFRLLPETLFLTVNILDRFLSRKVVQLESLQLVGVTAMFIASKYEEVLSPHVANFRHVADDGFTENEILRAERLVLATLSYDLSYPNPMNFLRRISKADNYDIHTRTIGKYLMEISLLDHRFMVYPQSHCAAASMYLARLMLDRGPWDATIAHYAGYDEKEIQPIFKLMVDYLHRPVSHEAFFKKYASKKFLKASIIARQWAKNYHVVYLNSSVSKAPSGEEVDL